jgi:hypothetical protein
MSQYTLELPTWLDEQIRALAAREGVSLEQFFTQALTEKMKSMDADAYLAVRAHRGSREKLLAVLAKAPDVEPEEADRLRS